MFGANTRQDFKYPFIILMGTPETPGMSLPGNYSMFEIGETGAPGENSPKHGENMQTPGVERCTFLQESCLIRLLLVLIDRFIAELMLCSV